MFKIEIIGKNPTCFYIKALGTFPQSVAKRFTEEFEEMTKDFEQFCAIVDISDFILLDVRSFNIILELLKRNNKKLTKSAFVISKNPPLDKEFQILLERADSPNRKIVNDLIDAKKWLGIEDIVFQND